MEKAETTTGLQNCATPDELYNAIEKCLDQGQHNALASDEAQGELF